MPGDHPYMAGLVDPPSPFAESAREATGGYELAETHETGRARAGDSRIAARILWPALGFPAVVAPRRGPGPSSSDSAVQRSLCVLLLSDRKTLTADDAARYLRIVPWADRARRHIAPGQPGSFSRAELRVRNDIPAGTLSRRHKDGRADAVQFGGGRYENSVVASLARAVRTFYARHGLRYLHEVRISEHACQKLGDDQYHLFWNGRPATEGSPSDEMTLLIDRFARPRRNALAGNTEAQRRWLKDHLGFLLDEYRFDYGALHPPYQAKDSEKRLTEVLHPVFVRRSGSNPLNVAHVTDTHVDVRADVYEENLKRAPAPMSWDGHQLRYRNVPLHYNNFNRSFARTYEDAKADSDIVLLTGDLIDYGRGHIGLVDDGRYRRRLGEDGTYHEDRNWFLFYYLLASRSNYSKPVYTALGNHDWRLNPYPPFAPGAPSPEALVHNFTDFKSTPAHRERERWLKEIIQIAHGPGHEKKYAYLDLDALTAARAVAGTVAGNLDFAGSPLQTTIESVIWYLLVINPFLDYAFPLPDGQQILMLDWAEDEEIMNSDEPRSFMGFGQRAANSLSALQEWHANEFARSPGKAKIVGIHAPPLGPYPDWYDDELRQGRKTYKAGQDSRMRRPDGKIRRVSEHTLFAVRPKDAPFGVAADHGSIVRQRDPFIRRVAESASGVRLVVAGHIHRAGLLVAYVPASKRQVRLIQAVKYEEVRGVGRGVAAVRRNASVRAFPSPLYVNTTSAGPLGNVYGPPHRNVPPGFAIATLGADGTIHSVSPRQIAPPRPPDLASPPGLPGVVSPSPVTRVLAGATR